MHILKFLLRFCGYHIRLVDKKNHYPRNSPLNWCRICLAGLQPPHASQVVTPSAWWSSPWLASPMWWVISVAALHSGPASAKFFSDDGTGGRKLPAGPGLPLLFVPWFSLLDWTKIWVTGYTFFTRRFIDIDRMFIQRRLGIRFFRNFLNNRNSPKMVKFGWGCICWDGLN